MRSGGRMKKKSRLVLLAARWAAAIACFLYLLPEWPVNYFEIATADEEGRVILAAPMGNGDSFVTTYIHSVQLSPVIDDYRIVGGTIWSWEERVQSHNAGLPFDAPKHGRFLSNPPWMIVQGGRHTFGTIILRIGDEQFGQNTWRLPPRDEVKIYRKHPGKRLAMRASVKALKDTRTVLAD